MLTEMHTSQGNLLGKCSRAALPNSSTMGAAYVLGWPKSPFSFFCKVKDTFFIVTNNFIDLDILSMLAISPYWLLVGRGQGCG